jgi:hypothetical protein
MTDLQSYPLLIIPILYHTSIELTTTGNIHLQKKIFSIT